MDRRMKIDFLWKFREHDREDPNQQINAMIYSSENTINEIEADLKAGGKIKENVELAVYKGKALLIQGNHRIVAAKRAGLDDIPTTIAFIGEKSRFLKLLHKFKKI